jgi:hypothetical protein
LLGAILVDLDIKFKSFPNSINSFSSGVIPVAILTSPVFDATTVNPATVRLGRNGTEASPVRFSLEDIDGDGDHDLLLHFRTSDTGIRCGDNSASVKGQTLSGQSNAGFDSVKTVGCN